MAGLSAYYTLGEPAGSTSAGDTSGNGRPPLVQVGSGTAVVFGSATGPATDSLTAATFAPSTTGKYLEATGATFVAASATQLTLEAFVSQSGTGGVTVARLADAALSQSTILYLGTGTGFAAADGRHGGSFTYNLSGAVDLSDGEVHHLAVRETISAGTVTAELLVNGVVVDTDSGALASYVNRTRLTVGGGTEGSNLSHVAVHDSALTTARIAAHAEAGLTGFTSDTSDERIARYAGYAGIEAADLALEVGTVTNIPHLDITSMSPLSAIAQVNAAEQGLVFVRGDGKLVFQNRDHRAVQVAADWTFAASPYLQGDLAFTADTQQLVNHVTASRANGSTQVAQDAASVDTHGQYPASYDSLLVSTDDEALDLANSIVSRHSEPGARLPSATIDLLASSDAFQQAWLQRELSDRITITGLPDQAPTSTVDLIVEGWTETLSLTEWTVTLNTTPFEVAAGWVLGDATYSVLGETTRLG